LRLVSFDRVTSGAFRGLLDVPIATLPMPYERQATPRDRSGTRPITVSVIGHQRPEKGFDLMPEVAEALLRNRPDTRILIHNAKPDQMREAQDKLRQLAARDSRIRLEEAVAGPALWASLLERSDLMLCPYDPNVYTFSHSSVACESLANAVPLVVPARTALSAQLEDFGGPGTSFESFTAQSIVSSLERVLDDFDRYADLACAAATKWAKTMGPGNAVERLLALAAAERP
jgi:glycosyltransferase involved in cell wall biosynthesis